MYVLIPFLLHSIAHVVFYNFNIFWIGSKEGWHGFIDVMLHFDDDNGPSAADRDDDKDDKGSAGASSQERPDSKTASKIGNNFYTTL